MTTIGSRAGSFREEDESGHPAVVHIEGRNTAHAWQAHTQSDTRKGSISARLAVWLADVSAEATATAAAGEVRVAPAPGNSPPPASIKSARTTPK